MFVAVSYTHLDVYKRQTERSAQPTTGDRINNSVILRLVYSIFHNETKRDFGSLYHLILPSLMTKHFYTYGFPFFIHISSCIRHCFVRLFHDSFILFNINNISQ